MYHSSGRGSSRGPGRGRGRGSSGGWGASSGSGKQPASGSGPGGGFLPSAIEKKARFNEDEDIDAFDDDMFDDDFAGDLNDGMTESGSTPSSAEVPETTSLFGEWKRPEPKSVPDASTDDLTFQQIDIDHYIGPKNEHVLNGRLDVDNGLLPVMRMYGIQQNETSILVHAHGFLPYFYIKCGPQFDTSRLDEFKRSLNDQVMAEVRQSDGDVKCAVVAVVIEKKESMYGFTGNVKSNFIKVFVALPRLVPAAARVLERGSFARFQLPDPHSPALQLFESNIDYDIRFMIDKEVVGCNWITLKAGTYTYRNRGQQKSRCQLEVDVFYEDIVSHAPDGEWAAVAPFRILSFDIECAGRKGVFPEPETDPVIQIASVVVRQGETEPFVKTIFTLGRCASIVGTVVKSFKTEKELLCAWADFVREVDPDILTGYNIQNFDLWYLLTRADALSTVTFPFLGRVKASRTLCKKKMLQSKQMGKRENKDINIEGRAQFDLLLVLLRDYKLRSYTLNAVSYHFLNEQKEDVHHSIITDLQNGDEQTRRRLAVYCVKDAVLPIRLLEKLMCIINYMEMARVTGVPLGYLLTRGQQIKVVSQLLRKAKSKGLLMPAMKPAQGDDFEGALVIEPKRGYYDVPIATLDFTSLYPSIMMAHNLCYTTLLNNAGMRAKMDQDDYIRTPVGSYFVKDSQRKGLLPEILEDLLGARKKAKTDLKNETDPFKRKVLDGRQLALKISANSVYGFTGAQVGKLPCLDISKSVTAFGRQMIEQTKNFVEENYTIASGFPADAEVVYGDTDSVMVKFGVTTVADAMDIGRKAAEAVTRTFKKPINLDFEKVYYPYLLINKKRYAGLYWTRPEKWDKMDCKGIETVRRDNCPLVSHLIKNCLQKLLIDRNWQSAVKHAQKVISDLLQNRVDISQLIISKELTKLDADYANKQPHVELAAKMTKRDAGSAPKLGDRVPYVIIAAPKGTAAYQKSEDPIYVLENSIPIDCQYYLENQISKPLLRIFEPIIGEAKAQSVLIRGDHTRTKTVVTSKVGAMAAFTKRMEKCLSCKTLLKTANSETLTSAVCNDCRNDGKESRILQLHQERMRELEHRFSRLWTECQRCQGSVQDHVICTSKDCPIFYMRTRAAKSITAQEQVMQRFGVPDW